MIYRYSVGLENDRFIDRIWAYQFSEQRYSKKGKQFLMLMTLVIGLCSFEEEYKNKAKLED